MKTILLVTTDRSGKKDGDSSEAADTKQRIMELHHHRQRLWGNMTVAQTLAHCTSGLGAAHKENVNF
jgi:hypothetical protein